MPSRKCRLLPPPCFPWSLTLLLSIIRCQWWRCCRVKWSFTVTETSSFWCQFQSTHPWCCCYWRCSSAVSNSIALSSWNIQHHLLLDRLKKSGWFAQNEGQTSEFNGCLNRLTHLVFELINVLVGFLITCLTAWLQACGHRFVKLYGAFKLRHMIGRCYLLGNDLQYDDADVHWQMLDQPCRWVTRPGNQMVPLWKV